jgi:hypothetical protein
MGRLLNPREVPHGQPGTRIAADSLFRLWLDRPVLFDQGLIANRWLEGKLIRRFAGPLFGLALVALTFMAGPAAATCAPGATAVATPAAFNNIRLNLAGNFCLTANINLAGLNPFVLIGTIGISSAAPFKGTLDGNGFAVFNLKIVDASPNATGLFRYVDGGTIKNVRFLNVDISAKHDVGAVAGWLYKAYSTTPPAITNVTVSGRVTGTGFGQNAGGVAGSCLGGAITNSSFAGTVRSSDSAVGGIVGFMYSPCAISSATASGAVSGGGGLLADLGGLVENLTSGALTASQASNTVTYNIAASGPPNVGGAVGINQGTISDTFALGAVSGAGMAGAAFVGGFIGYNIGNITRSFATGSVNGTVGGTTGGLAGRFDTNTISDSYATGPVVGGTRPAGGLIGFLGPSGKVARSFAAGKVAGTLGLTGGLVGLVDPSAGAVTNAYWDTLTSGQATSAVGTARTTTQLRAVLPVGFAGPNWGDTPTVTYPFLARANMTFWSTLAATVKTNRVYTFLPIGQLDLTQYAAAVSHANHASEAAVYTMIARAVGFTKNVPTLKIIKIDTSYWHDATQTTTWTGLVTGHVTQGAPIILPAPTPISLANIAGQIKANNVVVISGPSAVGTHTMLATGYMVNGVGAIVALIANDPYTGRQVRISPTTKKVIAPAGFPLATFTVTAYRVMTIL